MTKEQREELWKEFDEKFGVQEDNPLKGFGNIDIEASSRIQGTVKDLREYIEKMEEFFEGEVEKAKKEGYTNGMKMQQERDCKLYGTAMATDEQVKEKWALRK